MKKQGISKLNYNKSVLALAGILAVANVSNAEASKKVYDPYVEKGELEFELRSGIKFDDNKSKDGEEKHKLAIGYGVTDRWATEIYGVIEKEGTSGSEYIFQEIEWANKFQLTEAGQYFVDVGAYLAYSAALTGGHADAIEAQLLLAKDIGKFSNNANIEYKRQIGENSNDENEVELKWSTRYRYSELFEPGFEIYSNLGDISDSKGYDKQSHQIGPVFYGKYDHIKYEIGYLFGASDAAVDGEAKLLLEYEMRF